MSFRFPFIGQRIILSGDVLSLRFIVDIKEEYKNKDYSYNHKMWDILTETNGKLEYEIKKVTENILGPQFKVQSVTFRHGSVEILIVIGTIYYAISRYKNFIESIELFKQQLKSLLLNFFGGFFEEPISVYGTWSPGPALAHAQMMLSYDSMDAMKILLWYMLLSHAALLTVFIWMIVRSQ